MAPLFTTDETPDRLALTFNPALRLALAPAPGGSTIATPSRRQMRRLRRARRRRREQGFGL